MEGKKKSDSEFLSYNLMLYSGKKICAFLHACCMHLLPYALSTHYNRKYINVFNHQLGADRAFNLKGGVMVSCPKKNYKNYKN
jgi:hypothetical protein